MNKPLTISTEQWVELLGSLLYFSDRGIDHCEYHPDDERMDTIWVVYDNGYKREINVTGDSRYGMLLDVIRHM